MNGQNENSSLNVRGRSIDDRTASPSSKKRFFKVLWTKYAPNKKRKNKSFADGFLTWDPDKAGEMILYEDQGKIKSQTKKKLSELMHVFADFANGDGHDPVTVGGFEVELDEEVSEKDFLSGAAFMSSSAIVPPTRGVFPVASKGFVNPMGAVRNAFVLPTMKGAALTGMVSLVSDQKRTKRLIPVYDPHGEHALVFNKKAWNDDREGICPVVLNPSLYKRMRPHQKEGVQFLYRCVTEDVAVRRGAILADDMGLGKSLQTIALLETLLRQGPQGVPTVRKALIVAPSSLLRNWRAEIRKWLGEASTVKAIILGMSHSTTSKQGEEKRQTILDFKFGRLYNVGIISYETLRKYACELSGSIDILVADEGHRIKSASGNKTIDALIMASKQSRRVLLSGTPLQNNLSELFAMCDYVRPGSLGTYTSFQNVFAGPIEKSRDKNAKEEVKELGAARLDELKKMLAPFMLRRSSAVNQAYLPRLSSYAVFCRPSDVQITIIKDIISRRWHSDLYVGDEALVLLGELRKVCGHPALLGRETNGEDEAGMGGILGASNISEDSEPMASGKMETTLGLVERIVNGMGDRVVVVSQWTSMLNILEVAIKNKGFTTSRLDGSTPVSKRQDIVNAFNNSGVSQVFLLSTQAGGAGLNLIGANRLILYDSHWNPALDSQAMARIWRDGQKKHCFIYRLITTGSIEEKIYQRQMMKGQLARCCVIADSIKVDTPYDSKAKKEGGSFTREEVKELFDLKVGVSCMTADQLQSSGMSYVDDMDADDGILCASRRSGLPISFVFNERAQDESPRQDEAAPLSQAQDAEDSSDGELDVSDDF